MATIQQRTSDHAYQFEIILPKLEYTPEAIQKLRTEIVDLIDSVNQGPRRSASLPIIQMPHFITPDTRGRMFRKDNKGLQPC